MENELTNKLVQNIRSLKANDHLVQIIKEQCTLAEIKLIIQDWISLAKKFGDGAKDDVVNMYKSKISRGDAIVLAQHLQNTTETKKPSRLDVMTLRNDETTHIEIGNNKIGLYGGKKVVEKLTPGGIVGGISGPDVIAQLMSVCSKSGVAGTENKARVFAPDNKFAPQAALITAMTSLSELRAVTPNELEKQATRLKTLRDEDYEVVSSVVNASVPRIQKDGADVPVLVLEQVEEEGQVFRDVAAHSYGPNRYELMGEYTAVTKQLSVYSTGVKFPAIKRLGRKTWTGTPIDNFPCDHVIALHDAGVKPGEKILVVSADTNLISLLRSNFGAEVMGVGVKGQTFVSPSETPGWTFDWIYYPHPITMGTTGSFEDNCIDFKERMLKYCSIYTQAKPLYHVSPLAFYCKEFAEAFGVTLKASTDTLKMKINKIPNPAPISFSSSEEENFHVIPSRLNPDFMDDEISASHYKKNPSLSHKLRKIKTFTSVTWGALDGVKVNAVLTQMSALGTVLVGGTSQTTISALLGGVLSVLRDTFRAVWYVGHSSENTYKIRLFVPGAVVESLEFSDEYSAMYRPKEREEFAKADKKALELIVSNDRQEGPPKIAVPGKPPVAPVPVKVRPKDDDMSDFN